MNKIIFFMCGIHGSGKTTISKKIEATSIYNSVSASDIIREQNTTEISKNKFVKNIKSNQDILLEGIKKSLDSKKIYILDGHLCLLNNLSKVESIPFDFFKKLSPKAVILIQENINTIFERLEKRGSNKLNKVILRDLNKCEKKQAILVSKKLDVPLIIVNSSIPEKSIIGFINGLT